MPSCRLRGPDWQSGEGNLTVQIAALRRVLGQEPGGDLWIETLPRRGYRFVGPVAKPDEPLVSTAARAAAPSLPDKPSIVVLPFANLSDDPEQDYEKAPEDLWGHTWLTAALALLGDTVAAAEVQTILRRLQPEYSIAWLTQQSSTTGEVGEGLHDGLRRAGVPEE